MRIMFLTATDQIVDLSRVESIEVVEECENEFKVVFRLYSGSVLVSKHTCKQEASAEKWRAWEEMKK